MKRRRKAPPVLLADRSYFSDWDIAHVARDRADYLRLLGEVGRLAAPDAAARRRAQACFALALAEPPAEVGALRISCDSSGSRLHPEILERLTNQPAALAEEVRRIEAFLDQDRYRFFRGLPSCRGGRTRGGAGSRGVIVATVEARMTSSRLPGKMLLPLGSTPVLGVLLDRLKTVRELDAIVLATTVNASDDPLVEVANDRGVAVHRGSEDDVLGRVRGALDAAKADICVEITGDCPLTDPTIVSAMVGEFQATRGLNAYVANTTGPELGVPHGLDVQVFEADALRAIEQEVEDAAAREHVSLPFYRAESAERWKPRFVSFFPDAICRSVWLSLDYREDYALLRSVHEELGANGANYGARRDDRGVPCAAGHDPRVPRASGEVMAPFRVGILGMGKMSAGFDSPDDARICTHVKAVLADARMQIVQVADRDSARAAREAQRFGLTAAVVSPEEICAADLDVLCIATPDDTHAAFARRAAAGPARIVLCEKPLDGDVAARNAICSSFAGRGRQFAINHLRRWIPGLGAWSAEARAGVFGPPLSVCVHYTRGLRHNGIHALDLIAAFLGPKLGSVRQIGPAIVDLDADDPTRTLDGTFETTLGAVPFTLFGVDGRLQTVFSVDIRFERARVTVYDENGIRAELYRAAPVAFAGYAPELCATERYHDDPPRLMAEVWHNVADHLDAWHGARLRGGGRARGL